MVPGSHGGKFDCLEDSFRAGGEGIDGVAGLIFFGDTKIPYFNTILGKATLGGRAIKYEHTGTRRSYRGFILVKGNVEKIFSREAQVHLVRAEKI